MTLAVLIASMAFWPGIAVAWEDNTNRYNVVMVLDASGSMSFTDPNSLRSNAMAQFAYMLAEKGNRLGGVVFTHEIAKTEALSPSESFEERDGFLNALSSVPAVGDTNIGAALDTAITMIDRDGDANLPSVVLLLSDGNTDLADEEDLKQSLETKAEAIQRARDKGIPIYSVCLNADGTADVSEMRQISKATGGEFREVKSAEDLRSVYEAFYGLIFGTTAKVIQEDVFPKNGKLETEFTLPGLGVEEVNIIVYGGLKSFSILRPDGSVAEANSVANDTFTLIKLTDVAPGTWKLITEGVPGDSIIINMVCNTDLGVLAEVEPEEGVINPKDSIAVRAYLTERDSKASDEKQYEGYEAELQIMNASDESVSDTVPMSLAGEHFELVRPLEKQGIYKFKVHVTGNGLDKVSEVLGPITATFKELTEAEKNNTAPTPVENPVEHEVFVWPSFSPIGDKDLSIDLATLATDKEDQELTYAIVSSSFMDDDYNIKGNNLTITRFSIPKGAFTVRAMDSLGKSCDIEVIVVSHSVAMITAIVALVGLLIAIIVLLILLYIALTRPFRGEIAVYSNVDGSYRGSSIVGRRGRIKLTAFGLDPIGINYSKSYIQATGKSYVLLKTNVPVMFAGKPTKEVRVENGVNTIVSSAVSDNSLELHFRSLMNSSPFTGGKRRPKPPKPPKPPKAPRRGRF